MDETKSKHSKASSISLSKNQRWESGSIAALRMIKKRGVYIDRGTAKTPLIATVNVATQELSKAPRRPHRGQKLFLASVLNLLSKSSTGTQAPDTIKMKPKPKAELKCSPFEITNTTRTNNSSLKEERVNTVRTEKKKRKYISKVVENYREYDQDDNFEVIQPRKEIIQTPSLVYSDTGRIEENFVNIKWAEFLPRLVKPDPSEVKLEKERKFNHLAREVAEGRMEKEISESATLVAAQRSNNGLCNFFIDLLETTFSVYNDNPDNGARNDIPSGISSKVALEMDESVANKLRVVNESVEGSASPRNIHGIDDDHKLLDYFKKPCLSFSQQPETVIIKKRKKSELVRNAFTKHKISTPYSRSADDTQRTSKKQTKKNMLLSMLKEQLRMDNNPLEEPPNLYNALKVMARNKRKQKTIRFDDLFGGDYVKNTVKKRKVTVTRSKTKEYRDDQQTRFKRVLSQKQTKQVGKKINPKPATSTLYASKHSLEVVNVEYDTMKFRKAERKKPKEVTLTYHSSRSEIDQESLPDYPTVPLMQQIIMTVETVCGEPEA